MKTTLNQIKSLNPCSTGVRRLMKQLGTDFNPNEEFDVASLVGGENTVGDITWLITHIDRKVGVQLVIDAAELALPVFESESNSPLPRRAIEAAKTCLANPTTENKTEAFTAARAVTVVYNAPILVAAAGYATASSARAAGYAARYAPASSTAAAATYAAAAIGKEKVEQLILKTLGGL